MLTPNDVLKIIEEIEEEISEKYDSGSYIIDCCDIYSCRWEELKEKFEQMRILR